MSKILKMPRMGETMDEGKLLAWLVEPGQPFKRGDPLLEVETDKTAVEFPALGDGALVEALVDLGEMVDVGTPIARIDIGDGPDWVGGDEDMPEEDEAGTEEPPAPAPTPDKAPAPAAPPPGDAAQRPRATPVARKAARTAGIDLATITGTGRRGRIEHRDILAANRTAPTGLQTGHGIAWSIKGSATGAPVVMLHGFAADHGAWAGLQSQLARAGRRTIAVDLPAHGAAQAGAAHPDDLSAPVIAMAESELGWNPIHIVAHSMGALAAVALAKARPTASLTLIAPAGLGRKIDAEFLTELSAPRDARAVGRTLERMTHGPNGLSDTAHTAIFETLQQGRLGALARSLAGASGQAVDIRGALAELAREIPVSLVLGHRDRIVDWSEALDVSPLIRTHHFADAGHMPHWEALSDVTSIIERNLG